MYDYQPFPTMATGSPWAMEQPSPNASYEMLASLIAAQSAAQMPKPAAPRYEPKTLFNYYLAWEQNKQFENHEAFVSARYYHSKQWSDEEIKILKKRKQPVITKNRIKRKVDFLVGVEQRLRRDPKCFPRTPAAERAAPTATACLRFVQDVNMWQSVASEITRDAFIRNVGALWSGVKIVKGKPEIRKMRVQADRFFYDPRSEAWDFSDARYLGEHQWMDMDTAIELLPFAEKMINQLATTNASGPVGMLPQEFAKEMNWIDWVDASRRRIRLISIWYKCRGKWMFDYLVGAVSLCPEGYDCLSPYRGEDWSEENPTTDHPYTAWSAYVDESCHRYGIIRDMISSQDEINKRSSKALHLMTQRQTKGEKGAVEDVDAMKREMNSPDGHVEYMPGMEFDVLDQTGQIQGNLELLQEAKAEIENFGPNPALQGRGVESQSGRAILAQQNSGMTEMSPVFERMKEWKLRSYHKDWRLIQQFWTGERIVRVTSDPQALEFLNVNRIVFDPATNMPVGVENSIMEMDVDVLLDEGPDTITMREELMEQLAQFGPEAVPPEIMIELSNINEKDMLLRKMKEYKSPPAEVVALQSRLADLEAALKSAQVDKANADTDAQRASTMKTLAEVGANTATMAMEFPVHYREPSYIDQNAMASGMGGAPQGMPANPMMTQGPDSPPDEMAMPEQGNPQPPNPMMMTEPQFGAPGALPLGPGVGP